MISAEKKKSLVGFFIDRNMLINPSLFEKLADTDVDYIVKHNLDQDAIAKYVAKQDPNYSKVIVKVSYSKDPGKREVGDFVKLFNARYKDLENILKHRPELSTLTSINRVLNKRDKENISIIGMVKEKAITKNGNMIVTFEDPSGVINVVFTKSKKEQFEAAKELVYDEVVGIVGTNGDKIIFGSNIIWPDIPNDKELKKCPDEVYAAFISDVHVGSRYFLKEEFEKFIGWLNGEVGNEDQRRMASKLRYLFMVGDVVDGVGIYPGQEKELSLPNIYEQYEGLAEYIKRIPKHIRVILCPGNHDAIRLSEPQLPLLNDFAKSLHEIENVLLVSNPSLINIHSSENFSGLDVLIYHGYSFDHYANEIESIRQNGGYHRADLIMTFLLKRRHLAPVYTSTLYIPDPDEDPLVIKTVPDIFATGHIHYSIAKNYKGVTVLSSSCWQSITDFQIKMGHTPQPAQVPVINLMTRDIKMIKFGD